MFADFGPFESEKDARLWAEALEHAVPEALPGQVIRLDDPETGPFHIVIGPFATYEEAQATTHAVVAGMSE